MANIEKPKYYRVHGTPIEEQEAGRTWSRSGGLSSVRKIVGEKRLLVARFNELVALDDDKKDFDRITENYSGASGYLELTTEDFSGEADSGEASWSDAFWELQSVEILKPIETHKSFDELSAFEKTKILQAVRDAKENPFENKSTAVKLYAYLSNQVLDYAEHYLQLRQSIVVSSRTQVTGSYANINKVVPLPSGIPSYLSSSVPSGWEWMFKGTTCRTVGNKFQLSKEWIGADKFADIYGGSWSPTGV